MKNLYEYLNKTFGFTGDEVNQIISCFAAKQVRKKDFFLKAGQYCQNIAFVEKGSFIYFQNVDGEEKICNFAFDNDWVTYYKSLMGKVPSDMNMRSLEDSEIYLLDMEKMKN